jgi:hypothetical protein
MPSAPQLPVKPSHIPDHPAPVPGPSTPPLDPSGSEWMRHDVAAGLPPAGSDSVERSEGLRRRESRANLFPLLKSSTPITEQALFLPRPEAPAQSAPAVEWCSRPHGAGLLLLAPPAHVTLRSPEAAGLRPRRGSVTCQVHGRSQLESAPCACACMPHVGSMVWWGFIKSLRGLMHIRT